MELFLKFSVIFCILIYKTGAQLTTINTDVEIFGDVGNKTLDDIMNGAVGSHDMFPYLVSIQTAFSQHICGGTLLSSYYVLTAAHCTFVKPLGKQFLPRELRIRIGPENLRHPARILAFVKWIKIHEEYRNRPIDNDIAIIKVDRPLLSDPSDILPLSSSFITPSSVLGPCMAAGWGRLGPSPIANFPDPDSSSFNISTTLMSDTTEWYNNDTVPENDEESEDIVIVKDVILRFTLLPLQKAEECAKDYDNAGITEEIICAGERNGGTDTCKGDSGGPLICDRKIEGIVSFGDGCDNPEHLGVYTRVYKHRKWIEKKMYIHSGTTQQYNLHFVLIIVICTVILNFKLTCM